MKPFSIRRSAGCPAAAIVLITWFLLAWTGAAAPAVPLALSADRTKTGRALLRAFEPVTAAARRSVARLEVDGKPVALGAIVEANGLVLTKGSELGNGTLTCTLADGRTFPASVLSKSDENDLALIRIEATNLSTIIWSSKAVVPGEWAITPGVGTLPEAIGIVSVPPRRIFPKRAYLGVVLDTRADEARISSLMPGFGAAKAGLQPGDTILRVNQEPISNSEKLMNLLRTFHDGQVVDLHVRRDHDEFDTSIPLMIQKPEPRRRRFDREDRMNHLGTHLSQRAEDFQLAVQHDSVLEPWQCGGPVLNLDGEAIGLNIARAGRIASYALPASLVQELINELKPRL